MCKQWIPGPSPCTRGSGMRLYTLLAKYCANSVLKLCKSSTLSITCKIYLKSVRKRATKLNEIYLNIVLNCNEIYVKCNANLFETFRQKLQCVTIITEYCVKIMVDKCLERV